MGKTFYLASMPTFLGRHDLKPVLLKIISNEAGTVKIFMPTLEINMTYFLTPKVTDVFINVCGMRADVIGIDNKGIQIISTVEVAVYAIEGATHGGYGKFMPVIPVVSSAKVFVLESYESAGIKVRSQFVVVATEDSTQVNITLQTASPGSVTYNNVTFKDGDIIKVKLNRLQTFYAYVIGNDLSGSLIKGNKPIAVFSGTDCVIIPTNLRAVCNIVESQMTPVSQWGYAYIVPSIFPSQCHVRLFAFHKNTHISVNAKFALGRNITLNQGEFWETSLNGSQAQPLIISSNTVVSVVLYGAFRRDAMHFKFNPFMLVVPDISQYSTLATTFSTLLYRDITEYTDPFENYAAIVLLDASFNQIQYNGNAPEVLQNYSLLNNYTVVVIALKNVTAHTITSTVGMSTHIPLAVFVYGMAKAESYGFFAGYNSIYTGKKKKEGDPIKS